MQYIIPYFFKFSYFYFNYILLCTTFVGQQYYSYIYYEKQRHDMKDQPNLVEQTQRDILNYISSHPDCKQLPKEQQFVEILGVSRVVVREALSRLRALGIIETRKKKGTELVTPDVFSVIKTIIGSGLLDKESLRDLYQLRLMLEIGAADFIFQGKTQKQMEEMDGIIAREVALEKQMNEAVNDMQRYEVAKQLTEVDILFHSKLFEMTGNKSLMDFQYILRHLFTLYFPKIKTDYHQRNVVSHVGLFNLLRTGTPDAFRMAMRLHLSTQFENMELILDHTSNK